MGSLVSTIGNVIGGIGGFISGGKASDAAANTARNLEAAGAKAAEMARFRPVGISTRYGTSNFGFDSAGNISSAGYELSPELRSIQDFLMSQTEAGRGDTTRLLNLGRGYISETPQEAARRYYAQQRELIAPTEDLAYNRIKENLRRTGRGGLAVGQGGNLAQANPELQAFYNAVAQRDKEIAQRSELGGREQIAFGQGLLSSAYSPVVTPLGFATSLEEFGLTPFRLGANIGTSSAQAGSSAGNLLFQGARTAAPFSYQNMSYSPLGTALSGFSSTLSGGGGGSGGGLFGSLGNWFTRQSNQASPDFVGPIY
jgi:hypothetical protein